MSEQYSFQNDFKKHSCKQLSAYLMVKSTSFPLIYEQIMEPGSTRKFDLQIHQQYNGGTI